MNDRELLEAADVPRASDLLLAEVTRLPPLGRDPSTLSDRDKLALYIAAGGQTEMHMEGAKLTVRSARPFSVTLDQDSGAYLVAIEHPRTPT